MRRTLLLVLLALVVGAVIGTTRAQAAITPAAGWNATVIAKDGPRHALVVSLRSGAVRTVRTRGAAANLAPGTRIHTRTTRLADGTFRASGLVATGRARNGLVRGVVVKVDRPNQRLVLSAGGSVFSVGRKALSGRRSLQRSGSPSVGDDVQLQVQIAGGDVQATGIETLGTVEAVSLDGIVTANVPGKLTIAVVHRGLVDVTVPAGVQRPAFVPGDLIVLDVSVDANGVFTLVEAFDASGFDPSVDPSVDPGGTDVGGATGGDDEADDDDGDDDDSASEDHHHSDDSSVSGQDDDESEDDDD